MATLTAGQTATLGLDAWASVTLVVDGKATLDFTSSVPNLHSSFSVSNATTRTYGPYGVPMSVEIVAVDKSLTYTVGGEAGGLAYDSDGAMSGFTGPDGEIVSLSEVSAYVAATASAGATLVTGACELAGYICTTAAGNITIYDNASAAGTVILPTTALVVGSFPIMGAGTNTRLALTTGCHVVLSGAAAVNVLVQ